jgi:O-antigen/teichoic acid export membrane protein
MAHRAAVRLLPAAEPPGQLTRDVLRFAAVGSIALVISLVVFQRVEVLFLQHFSDDEQIALYSVPFSIVVVLLLAPRSLNMVIVPTVATLIGAGEVAPIRSGFGRAVRMTLVLAVPVTALAAAVGPELITLLYGSAFEDSGPVLLVLLATIPFVPLMALSQSLLIGLGRQWVPTAILTVTAAVNISLAFALIPPYEAVGAAIANATAQVFGAVALVAYASACVGGVVLDRGALARALVVALFAGGAAFAVVAALPPVAGPVLATVLFGLLAVPLAALLRVIPPDDASWLAGLLGPRLGSSVRRSVGVLWHAPVVWSRNR